MSISKQWEHIGEIGVDAGLCWVGDPCYVVAKDSSNVFDSWSEFCVALDEKEEEHNNFFDFGFVGKAVHTGYGDGCYNVFVKRENESGRIAELKVVFIEK